MGPDRDAVARGELDGPQDRRRIAGVGAAGDVDAADERDQLLVRAHRPRPERLADVGVQVDPIASPARATHERDATPALAPARPAAPRRGARSTGRVGVGARGRLESAAAGGAGVGVGVPSAVGVGASVGAGVGASVGVGVEPRRTARRWPTRSATGRASRTARRGCSPTDPPTGRRTTARRRSGRASEPDSTSPTGSAPRSHGPRRAAPHDRPNGWNWPL